MKSNIIVVLIICVFSYCGTVSKTGSGTQNPTRNAMRGGRATTDVSDTIVITGTQTLPILGRNEAGVRPDIEGTWELQSSAVNLNTNTNNITAGKSFANEQTGKEYTGRVIDETMKGTREVSRDSVTTKSNGVTHTSTTVYLINKDAEGNKITPPQSSNPNVHIPEKPSIRFYGSNETFSGFTGCNKISGRYVMRGNSISFQNPSASTRMACIGAYDENAFISSLNRVDAVRTGNGKLELLAGDEVLLTFTRK